MSITLRVTYADMYNRDYDSHEFGIPWSWGTMWHRLEGVLVMSYDGKRIAELYPDGSLYLIMPKKGTLTNAAKRRWTSLFGTNVEISSTMKRSAVGNHEHTLSIYERVRHNSGTYDYSSILRGKVTASDRILVDCSSDNCLKRADFNGVGEAVKDKTKYRTFLEKLRQMRAAITAQVKMGAYEQFHRSNTGGRYSGRYNQIESGIRACFPEQDFGTYVQQSVSSRLMYNCVLKWIDDPSNAALLKPIVLTCMFNHTSDLPLDAKYDAQDILRRVNSGLNLIRQTYLREHCVKIEASNNSLRPNDESTDDQNCELFSTAGLREMQIPSKAQVC